MHVCTAHVCTYTHLTSFKTNFVRLLLLRQKTFKWKVSEVDSFAVQIFVWKDAQTMPFTIDLQCLLPRLLAIQKSRRMRLHNAHNMMYTLLLLLRPSQEAKLFLIWEKMINLLLRQVRYRGNFSEVVPHLTSLATGMTRFGEDKVTEGILGVIGLGKKSCYSHQYVPFWLYFPTVCQHRMCLIYDDKHDWLPV